MIISYDQIQRGRFVVFEGPNGSGKTTIIKKLQQSSLFKEDKFFFTKEPGGSKIFKSILRDFILDKSSSVDNLTELFLILADRREHVLELKASSKNIICDRYIYSTIAFQGAGRGLGSDWTTSLCKRVCEYFLPDLVILIDCEPSIGLRRKQNKDRLELEDLAFHQRVRQEYLNLAAQEPVPFLIINTDEGLWEEYQKIVEKAVCKVFNV